MHAPKAAKQRLARALCCSTLAAWVALSCTAASDEDLLKERVDVAKTHLYVALKAVLSEGSTSPELAETRKLLASVSQGFAQRSQSDTGPQLNLRDTLDVTKGLWALKTVGADEVRKWRASELSVLTPTKVPGLDLPSEHALLLVGLTLARFHPKAPAPVPDTTLLYEAYLMGSERLPEPELESIARSVQAYVYATAELCDLAQSATALFAQAPSPSRGDELQRAALALMGLGRAAAHAPKAAEVLALAVVVQNLPWLSRLLAHATTGQCWDARQQTDKALEHYQRALDVLQSVGISPEELALLRAYVAFRANRPREVHAHLLTARGSRFLDDRTKQDLDRLIEHFDPDQRGALEEFFAPALLTHTVLGILHRRLEEQGVYTALERLVVSDELRASVRALDAPLQTPTDLWQRARTLFE